MRLGWNLSARVKILLLPLLLLDFCIRILLVLFTITIAITILATIVINLMVLLETCEA